FAVAVPHHLVDGGGGLFDEVEHPEGATGAKGGEDFFEHGVPLVVGAKVMEGGGGEDDVEAGMTKVEVAHVALERGHDTGGGGRDARHRALEHGAGKIDEGDVEAGDFLEH